MLGVILFQEFITEQQAWLVSLKELIWRNISTYLNLEK